MVHCPEKLHLDAETLAPIKAAEFIEPDEPDEPATVARVGRRANGGTFLGNANVRHFLTAESIEHSWG